MPGPSGNASPQIRMPTQLIAQVGAAAVLLLCVCALLRWCWRRLRSATGRDEGYALPTAQKVKKGRPAAGRPRGATPKGRSKKGRPKPRPDARPGNLAALEQGSRELESLIESRPERISHDPEEGKAYIYDGSVICGEIDDEIRPDDSISMAWTRPAPEAPRGRCAAPGGGGGGRGAGSAMQDASRGQAMAPALEGRQRPEPSLHGHHEHRRRQQPQQPPPQQPPRPQEGQNRRQKPPQQQPKQLAASTASSGSCEAPSMGTAPQKAPRRAAAARAPASTPKPPPPCLCSAPAGESEEMTLVALSKQPPRHASRQITGQGWDSASLSKSLGSARPAP